MNEANRKTRIWPIKLTICLITYFSFVFGDRLIKYLGTSAVNAITRIMGLILATIGTQMVIAGVGGLLPQAH